MSSAFTEFRVRLRMKYWSQGYDPAQPLLDADRAQPCPQASGSSLTRT
jgi:hypothetical protein